MKKLITRLNITAVEALVAKLNKKATRLGLEPLTCEFVRSFQKSYNIVYVVDGETN